MNAGQDIAFDGWVLRPMTGELFHDGACLRLQDRALQILTLLLSRPGELVTREELIAHLWPKTVVDYDTGINTAMRKLRIALNDDSDAPRYVETVPRKGYRFIGKIEPATSQPAVEGTSEGPAIRGPAATITTPAFNPPAHSIAVLPFVNMSGDPQQEYFSDGMAEELLNSLVRMSELKVAARTSAFSFKGKDMEIGEIARKLNVASILEGSVRKSGEQVRINVKLVNAVDGYHMWSQTYDRKLEDTFEVQADIAASVVRQLQATLLGSPASPTHTPTTEAYTAYLRGNYFRGRVNLDKAISCYEQALQLDERYPAAMVGLAQARFGFFVGVRPATDVAVARQLIDRAIALDPHLAEAYLARAMIARLYDFDWAAAEVSLKRARELEPNNVAVLRGAALLAETLGRFDESGALLRQSLERDPLLPSGHAELGRVLLATGKLVAAEASLRTTLEIDPELLAAHAGIALTLLYRKEPDKALAEAQLELNCTYRLLALALIYHASHRKAESDAALRELTEKHASDAPFVIASIHAYRGEIDEALSWLDQAYRNRDASVARLLSNRLMRNLTHDPRYQAFLRKLNLPTEIG